MPASPVMRFSPGREPRADNHKRGRSLESGVVFKERDDDDLALFNEVQNREKDNFLLQSNDDFEDNFVTKLRHFSDHKHGINTAARGESSDFLNTEEEKNDYEWLITPPDTPLFSSLDDESPQVILPQRGRPRAQPISISRSSTMEKSHRSSRGSPSPNRLSPSPRSGNTPFQPRGQPSSAPTTKSKRPSSPSSRPSTPTSRRLSTGSTSTTLPSSRGISSSPKIRAWQANIPGFSTEAPPNLRTSLVDRPASYVRGSSPASRNSRHSKSPTPSRSISSSHSHKGSIASSNDDDVESLPSISLQGSDRSNLRKVSGFRNNKAPFSQKPSRTVSSSSAPKRSFDLALRQMDHKRGPQNMFRPLLSGVPSNNLYAGKLSPAWNSSVTTSSNASSDLATSRAHDIEETQDSVIDDEVFVFEKIDSLNQDSQKDKGFENLVVPDDDNDTDGGSPEVENLKDSLICSKCGCEYSDIRPTEDQIKLCANCQKLFPPLSIQDSVTMPDEDHESFNTLKLQMTPVEVESSEMNQFEQEEDSMKDDESTHAEPKTSLSQTQFEEQDSIKVNHQLISQHTTDFQDSKVDFLGLKRLNSTKGGNFSASSISYDDLSYVRDSTNSMRSSLGRGSLSASSSFDFGPRFHHQWSSKKSEPESHKHRRSLSSFSGISSHAFHPSSVGTSTLDSLDVSNVCLEKEVVVDTASKHLLDETENEDVNNIGEEIASTSESPTLNQETHDSEEVVLPESLNLEEVDSYQKDEDIGKHASEEDTNLESTNVAEVQLSVISEGEIDDHISQSDVSQHSENIIEEESEEPRVSNASGKDIVASAMDSDTSNYSSSIIDESMVLVEGKNGRSLTLEEATETILFCSSIVHNLAYKAADIAIEKQTPPPPEPLVPTIKKGRKEVQIRKRSSRSQKGRQKKANMKASNNTNTNEETDLLPKTSGIVFPNNKENTRPLGLESKCNCRIM